MLKSFASFYSHIHSQHKSLPQFHCSGPYWESVVELVGEQRVGQLSEVQLAEGAHWVDVLPEGVSGEVWDLLGVKLVPRRQREEEEDIEECGSHPTAHLSVWNHKNKEDTNTYI